VELAELDALDLVDVAGGLEHDEVAAGMAVELRALVAMVRVLDRGRVELELVGDSRELVGGRPVHADPGHAAALARQLGDDVERGRVVGAGAVDVDRRVDHGHERLLRVPPTLVSDNAVRLPARGSWWASMPASGGGPWTSLCR